VAASARGTAVWPRSAVYIELLGQNHSKPTVKQHLAAIRMLFDWLVTGQVIPLNPAHAVRGPRHSVKKGKTSVLSAEEMRTLLDSIKTNTLLGFRDRALIALMGYTFARDTAEIDIVVTWTGTPPAAGTLNNPEVGAGAKRMIPSRFQVPPTAVLVASQTIWGGPPAVAILFSLP